MGGSSAKGELDHLLNCFFEVVRQQNNSYLYRTKIFLLPAPSSAPTRSASRRKPVLLKKEPYQPRQASGFAILEGARQGVETRRADALAELLGLTLKELAPILQVAESTLHRLRREGRLDVLTSERLLLLENLAAYGLAIFDNNAEALARWLRHPLRELKGAAPVDLLTSISGFGLVDDVLTRIEYGVYA
jgi:putative toxin-antitoxin system antitoxin component (TIGR02293 family)